MDASQSTINLTFYFQAEYKLKKSRATAIIDEHTKMRFVKTKDVTDGEAVTAPADCNGEVIEAK